MSGICDTCKRESCHMRFDGCKTCDVYEGGETRYEQLFGTPERAARTFTKVCEECRATFRCRECPLYPIVGDNARESEFLEWLEGDA